MLINVIIFKKSDCILKKIIFDLGFLRMVSRSPCSWLCNRCRQANNKLWQDLDRSQFYKRHWGIRLLKFLLTNSRLCFSGGISNQGNSKIKFQFYKRNFYLLLAFKIVSPIISSFSYRIIISSSVISE